MKKLFIVCLLAFTHHFALAQLTVVGEIRPRAEFRNGFKSLIQPSDNPAFFIEQRSRLYFKYEDSKYGFNLTLQDVRLWGENSQIFKSDNGLFNVYEAWGSYKFNENWLIKAGRQALDYDNARILGNLAWAQQARSHDVLLFEHENNGLKFHLGAAFNQEDVNARPEPARLIDTFYSGVNNYKTMQFGWLHKKWENGKFSLLLLNNGIQAPDSTVNFSQTAGFTTSKHMGYADLNLEFYYQYGSDPSGLDLRAYMASVSLGMKFGNTNITIGSDYLTGDEAGDNVNNAFTPLYGTNHKFYGFMDYFYVGSPSGNVGLFDAFLKFGFKMGEKSVLNIHGHQFMSQIDLIDGEGASQSRTLGTEIDLVYNLNIDKAVNLKVGYSQMIAATSMELIKNGESDQLNNWAWVMFTVKPTLFQKVAN